MRAARPQETAEMLSRPRSSTFIAVLKPWPGTPPMMFAAGTRASSRITSQVLVPRWPIFLSGLPSDSPGVSAGTMKAETPPAPGPPVRAISVKAPARGALVMKRLLPLRT
jgi:hypothetical protein